jgi:chloramphenicol-sensitive protein RarD
VLLLLIPAPGFLVWLTVRGESHFLQTSAAGPWLLLFCGVVTAVPPMVYANGAKLLRFSTIAIMQHVLPTMVFLIAVFVFGEPMIAFPLIWAALVLCTWSMLRKSRR